MRHYVQFYDMTTGYIAGTIPPQFSPDYAKPSEALGGEAVFMLDNRLSLKNMIRRGHEVNANLRRAHKYVGFKIMQGHDERPFSTARALTPYIELQKPCA